MILDSIGGCNWEKNVSSLAVDGRWVLYGTMGGKSVKGDLLGRLLSKRGHLLTSLLRSRCLQVRRNCVFCFISFCVPVRANLLLTSGHNVYLSVLNDCSVLRRFCDLSYVINDICGFNFAFCPFDHKNSKTDKEIKY